jgi:hypothetical protein
VHPSSRESRDALRRVPQGVHAIGRAHDRLTHARGRARRPAIRRPLRTGGIDSRNSRVVSTIRNRLARPPYWLVSLAGLQMIHGWI